MKIDLGITIEVDEEELERKIIAEYGEINQDNVVEYINNHIKAKSTSSAFVVQGAETDGWLVDYVEDDKFMEYVIGKENENVIY